MGRTLVVGDIHGGLLALIQVFKMVNLSTEDKIIFLGDYVDGWNDSALLINFLINLNQTNECIFIRGNHDIWCQEWLQSEMKNDVWLQHGGRSTIESYRDIDQIRKEVHLNFFNGMVDYYVDNEGHLFIHAGYKSMQGPAYEIDHSIFSTDRSLWEIALALDEGLAKEDVLYPKRLLVFNEIFIGHTPTTKFGMTTPMNKANIWNIDTGAAFTGPLTILDIKTKEFWQSEPVQSLYPDQRGRNKI
jgi:serine/threonine protein phosphatase 1